MNLSAVLMRTARAVQTITTSGYAYLRQMFGGVGPVLGPSSGESTSLTVPSVYQCATMQMKFDGPAELLSISFGPELPGVEFAPVQRVIVETFGPSHLIN
jgi:hypothetical protein